MKLPPLVAHVVVLIGAAVVSALASAADARPAAPDPERARELVHIVRQDCGSCHGLTLKGGLGPALTAEALFERIDALSETADERAEEILGALYDWAEVVVPEH